VPDVKVFDGHNDALLVAHMREGKGVGSFLERNDSGHLDVPRAKEGGFVGGFFAVMGMSEATPGAWQITLNDGAVDARVAAPISVQRAQHTALTGAGAMLRLEELSKGEIKLCTTAGDLDECLRNGALAAILHFEGAEPIASDLSTLEVFYRVGLRSLGLTWSRPNVFAHGVPFMFPHSPDTGPGLTDEGKELVKECNRLGIMIDLSHLNEKGFWDVAETSEAPLVATHSNAHALCQATRNLTDRQLDAIKDSQGMVGVNFAVSFLREDGGRETDVPLSTVVKHFAYLVDHVGIDHVGFGSDFDGAGIPNEIGDATGLPKLVAALGEHGFDDSDLNKLGHENWLSLLRKTWR
jgi:membrane dipeptidase